MNCKNKKLGLVTLYYGTGLTTLSIQDTTFQLFSNITFTAYRVGYLYFFSIYFNATKYKFTKTTKKENGMHTRKNKVICLHFAHKISNMVTTN